VKAVLQSTEDLALPLLKSVFDESPWDGIVQVEEGQMCFRSAEPPSWMTLVASLQWWQALLGAGLGIAATTFVTEATKDAWKQRSRGVSAAKGGVQALASLATKIVALRGVGWPNTRVQIGIPMQNEFFPAILDVSSGSPAEIKARLAAFCIHAPAILKLTEDELFDPVGSPVMQLRDTGDLEIRWMDGKTLGERKAILPRPNTDESTT
jgi:hypothetical protein